MAFYINKNCRCSSRYKFFLQFLPKKRRKSVYLFLMFCPWLLPSLLPQVAVTQKRKLQCATSKVETMRVRRKNDEQVGKVRNINNKKNKCSEMENIL